MPPMGELIEYTCVDVGFLYWVSVPTLFNCQTLITFLRGGEPNCMLFYEGMLESPGQ